MNFNKNFVILIVLVIIFFCNRNYESFTKYETSNNDQEYLVQDFTDSKTVANKFSKIEKTINKFVNILIKKHPNDKRVIRLKNNLKNTKYEESSFNDDTSSFTINKGELISICVRHQNDRKKFHNMNTMMFVILHELAHVMSVSIGHGKEFMDNFRFLLKESKESNIYIPVDYSIDNMTYCGVKVTHNPYYNHI